jgi:hypothetical protein
MKREERWRDEWLNALGERWSDEEVKGLNPELEEAVGTLLKEVMADPAASLTDKTKVLDRALKLEQIKQKISDDEWGKGFYNDDEGD